MNEGCRAGIAGSATVEGTGKRLPGLGLRVSGLELEDEAFGCSVGFWVRGYPKP